MRKPRTHLLITDTQVKPGNKLNYIDWLGQYIIDKKPDVVVCIGDWFDMPSLSSYDKGKKSYENRRYKKDILVGHLAMDKLWEPTNRFNKLHRGVQYNPEKHFMLGNHEYRIARAVEAQAELEGTIGLQDLQLGAWGWKVHPFLKQKVIDGIVYMHYFPSGPKGQPLGTAKGIISKYHQSAVCGHLQGRDIAYGKRADGTPITAIIAGSYYPHDEDYLSPFTNNHWRGIYVFHEVRDGSFDEMPVSIEYLRRRYS
jgi:hypothetical protein